jgi:hypothetical protein
VAWADRVRDSLLPRSREQSDLQRALQEWVYSGSAFDRGRRRAHCELCGQPDIRYQFRIANRSTGHELLVGSECITRFEMPGEADDGCGAAPLSPAETRRALRAEKRRLLRRARDERVLAALHELDRRCFQLGVRHHIEHYRQRGAFGPRQLVMLLNELRCYGVEHERRDFRVTVRRAAERRQLLRLAGWELGMVWACLSPGQRAWYVAETGEEPG